MNDKNRSNENDISSLEDYNDIILTNNVDCIKPIMTFDDFGLNQQKDVVAKYSAIYDLYGEQKALHRMRNLRGGLPDACDEKGSRNRKGIQVHCLRQVRTGLPDGLSVYRGKIKHPGSIDAR